MTPKRYSPDSTSSAGASDLDLITSPEAYELMHCFPNAYRLMDPGDTPRIAAFGDRVSAEVVNGAFDAFMMKDFVKSVKQTGFPQRIETPLAQDECDHLSEEFIRLRGGLYTGGIVCKQYVELKKYAMRTNEWRGFYLEGRLLTLSGNSMQFPSCPKPPDGLVARMEGFRQPFLHRRFRGAAGRRLDGPGNRRRPGVGTLPLELEPEAFYAALTERLATETDPQHFPYPSAFSGLRGKKNERHRSPPASSKRLSIADG